jgi:hypothetical protein
VSFFAKTVGDEDSRVWASECLLIRGKEYDNSTIILLLLFLGGGGYYEHQRWGAGCGAGIRLGKILMVVMVIYLLGGLHL